MSNDKWKKFEKVVFEIHKELAPNCKVVLDDKLMGFESKTNRQIDISIRHNAGPYEILIVIDCKDYKEPVDVKDMGEFSAVVKDVRAQKGAMVSSSGFTSSAIEYAKNHKIDTFRLVDTNDIDWKCYVTIPALLKRSFISKVRIKFAHFSVLPVKVMPSDPRHLRIYDKNERLIGTPDDIIAEKWNKDQIDNLPGEKEVLLSRDNLLEIGNQRIQVTITAILLIENEYFLGQLPVYLKGLKDEQSGGLITTEFLTANINPFEIEQGNVKNWQKIYNLQELSIKPVLTLEYKDCITKPKTEYREE